MNVKGTRTKVYWAQVYLSLSFVFACLTPHNIVIEFLVPRAFQKYSTCMVYSDFLLPGPSVFVFVFVFVFVYLHV